MFTGSAVLGTPAYSSSAAGFVTEEHARRYPRLSAYLWRVDNLLLHVVDFHPYDRTEEFLGTVAEEMDERARR